MHADERAYLRVTCQNRGGQIVRGRVGRRVDGRDARKGREDQEQGEEGTRAEAEGVRSRAAGGTTHDILSQAAGLRTAWLK